MTQPLSNTTQWSGSLSAPAPRGRIATLVDDENPPLPSETWEEACDRNLYYLTVIVGDRFDGILPLTPQGVVLGRARDADKTLSDAFVSERHARIYQADDGCYAEDLGSTNGTFVSGRRITKATRLWEGGSIQIGRGVRLKLGVLELHQANKAEVLSGVRNRRHFETRLSEEIACARRNAEALALIMLDIDGFKRVNAAHGDATGDAVLRVFTEAVRRTLRPEDALGRIGADVFMVIIRGTTAINASILAERLRRAIDSLQLASARPGLHVTASIGVAAMDPNSGASALLLLAMADRALHRAKIAGGNCVISVDAS